MDNQANDTLVPTGFTELWMPLLRTGEPHLSHLMLA
jgi:hypothetical protein